MTLEQIDAALAEWQGRLNLAGANLSASRLWASDRAGREIEQILSGPSVLLPAAPVPLAQRELLSSSDSTLSITPQQLLATMTSAFDAAKSTILAVNAAWNRLEPLPAAAERGASSLQALAADLGEPAPPALARGRQKVEGLRARVATDPLGVQTDFAAELSPPLARARAWLDDLAQQGDRVGR